MATSAGLPGFNTPAVGFEQPFAMLEACHERVERTLTLLSRLRSYLRDQAVDDAARQAARDVLRYFDIAGPHHHEDEERHVFPPLQQHADALVRDAVVQLQADHVQMHDQWQRLRAVLLAWRDAEPAPAITDADRTLVRDFVAAYQRHIPLEESVVYPAARPLFSPAELERIGTEMAQRRRG